jgi:cob(I)alamin adenosyltransferase
MQPESLNDIDSESLESSTDRPYPKSAVYTKTGDKGSTSLYTGERRSKADPIFDALGTVDELSAHIGLAREYCLCEGLALNEVLDHIQSCLFDIGTHIATPLTTEPTQQTIKAAFAASNLSDLELKIDELDSELPTLRNFILSGGGLPAAELHVCRTVCRRAERLIIPLYMSGAMDQAVLKFINRLSDFFFVAARWACLKTGRNEIIYKKGAGLRVQTSVKE